MRWNVCSGIVQRRDYVVEYRLYTTILNSKQPT